MDLSKYKVDAPYPVVSGLKENKNLAMKLVPAYSGQSSEFTTVSQYAYHRLKCMHDYKEIADVFHGIFLVETHHLQLVGDCVNQLGLDPRYIMYINQRPLIWQSEVVDYKDNVEEMILTDIEAEKGAANFYMQTAQAIKNPKISPLLFRLAQDEMLHVKMFSELHKKYFAG